MHALKRYTAYRIITERPIYLLMFDATGRGSVSCLVLLKSPARSVVFSFPFSLTSAAQCLYLHCVSKKHPRHFWL